jgi:hypothetical protein
LVQHTPPLHAPPVHGEVADSYTQFWASFEQVASVLEFAHAVPAALQTGSALQPHAPIPAAPAQLWCAPQGELDAA